ncbi:phytoene desaturase family protein [Nocardioides bruguierae]|uniref:Pyridine nucleotide-disulfide oxidoreductase domain-containing protein 2 n=1 Tax=Nocardioides bruguierae TaxID=2945102 RepID=A0A9X2D997_9ACTN|nr:NAD(P)/FAD-dependent oxidoreductase [Nocardioides bruguierae]MCL8025570.1 NAD(P)/FAD-dependent oxidoreductase [Nocardioides bruguierae]MCM0620429.1 NAD(P)/FAD-dependent oxidoreductase [Nocardioides bruguierae]
MSTVAASRDRYDVVVVGGGHNGLTSAALLARAGLSVLVLERLGRTGGAAVSAPAFTGHDVRLSRYSYLVSLMPEALMADLDLAVDLRSRRTASFTPTLRGGVPSGLHVHRPEDERTAASFAALTGGTEEYAAWQSFYGDVERFAAGLAPTFLRPLPSEADAAALADPQIWTDLVQRPLGEAVERRFTDDTVRGVVGTDALIGTFASLHDPSLAQNRCFLYHLVGNGTGEWRVPVGGMGAVTDALLRAATGAGAEVLTGAGVSAVRPGADEVEVAWDDEAGHHAVRAGHLLSGVAPWVLRILLGEEADEATKPAGSQLKINLLLERLPRLRSGADPREAFAGTLHIAEDHSQIERAYHQAAEGVLPDVLPGEVYCHSLTDPSILGSAPEGWHTMTYFGLHTPAALFADPATRAERKDEAVRRAIAALDEHLEEPLLSCVATDADGRPCVEAKVPQDVEADLAMPGGHIFHGDLEWPWAPGRALLDTPARRWGVQTDHERVLLCGSGARRGGAVSGIGGHNAAQAVLEAR